MRTLLIIITLLLSHFGVMAQPGAPRYDGNEQDREAFEKYLTTRRIAFFTKKINLTPEEAVKFWPEYNKYSKRVNELDYKKQQILRECEESKDANADLSRYIFIVKEEAALQERFQKTLLSILPPEKILALYKADIQFRHLILKEMRNNNPPPRRGPSPNANKEQKDF